MEAREDVEKQSVSLQASDTGHSAGQPRHHGLRARERLRHFLHPDGRKIHIALSPTEAEQIRQTYHSNSAEHFDVVISGSKEHLDTLKTAQSHHAVRQGELRARHAEAYEHITHVNNELAAIADELNRVTTHGVSLEAHFGRFGYDAHVRSYDDDPYESGTATPRSINAPGTREG